MNNYSVYKHTFPNGKIYIGITSQKPFSRWDNGRGYEEHQPLMWKAICKYGWDNIKHEILYKNLIKEQAEQKEIKLIALYKSNNSKYGYNCKSGGCSGTHSKETRAKISKAHKGKIISKESRIRMSIARKGKPLSDEHKNSLRKPNTKRKLLSEEHKEKIRQANLKREYILTEQGKNNIINSNKQRIYSDETRKKISENTKKGMQNSEAWKNLQIKRGIIE